MVRPSRDRDRRHRYDLTRSMVMRRERAAAGARARGATKESVATARRTRVVGMIDDPGKR
jgi:hypothetical protein